MFSNIVLSDLLITYGITMILGLIVAYTYSFKQRYSKNFVVQLAILPLVVQAVISLVNGNVGTGLAVMGAFSLVRFRSIAGTSRDIGFIFISMAVGLAAGMSYLDYAIVFTIILCLFYMFVSFILVSDKVENIRTLKITIAEDVDYLNEFNSSFKKYTDEFKLIRVKTTNMGSMYQLSYDVVLKQSINEKSFIDDLRIKNGNLNIILGVGNLGKDVL